MNSGVRIFQLSKILVISQLRASRSSNGRSRLWERPAFILFADILAISASWLATYEILGLIAIDSVSLLAVTQLVLSFVPVFALAIPLLAGIMLELNASSKFSSTDMVNWLPIRKSEYVAASGASVGYMYSPYVSVAVGTTLALSLQTSLFVAWLVSCVLSVISLLNGGFLIEIVRASINRAYTTLSRKTGKTTLVIRIALTVLVIAAFESIFYPNFLFGIMNRFAGALEASFFVPLVWPSLTITAVMAGDTFRSLGFGLLSLAFSVMVFMLAVALRSKYWSPSPSEITFANRKGYVPHNSRIGFLGISPIEYLLISKDLKAYVRKKELLAYIAMPFVFAAILAIQRVSIYSESGGPTMSWLIVWFAGFYGVILSATSVGAEGKSILNMYLVPISYKQLVKAKTYSSLTLSLMGALILSAVGTLIFAPNAIFFLEVLMLSILVSVQSVFIGLSFAMRYSDFVERPRPRYLTISGMLMVMLVGSVAIMVTSSPMLLLFQSEPFFSVLASLVSFSVITLIANRYSHSGAEILLREMKG